jgi:uncharacterized protein (DUF779 family)
MLDDLENPMFDVDESPARVVATQAATAHLTALAERQGDVTVWLSEGSVLVLPDARPPAGSVHLGRLDARVAIAADGSERTAWWRNRAHLDVDPARHGHPEAADMTYALTALSEAELYAAVAGGPLPRY